MNLITFIKLSHNPKFNNILSNLVWSYTLSLVTMIMKFVVRCFCEIKKEILFHIKREFYKNTVCTGFEPVRAKPIPLLTALLNHSDNTPFNILV